MGTQDESKTIVHATVVQLPEADRRGKRRARIAQPVRVRPSEPFDNQFDEVKATINVCRNGVYFSTERDSYTKGLRLFITFPYHNDPSAINLEYIGKVVRVDALPNGKFGVAVHLLMTVNLKGSGTNGQVSHSHF